MPCLPILEKRRDGKLIRTGTLCLGGPVYDFEGFLFEVHSYLGPIPLRRTDGLARARTPRGFWAAWDRFEELPVKEQDTYRVG